MIIEIRYSSKSFRRHADITVFNSEGKELHSVGSGNDAVGGYDGEGVVNDKMSGFLTKAQQETLARMAEVPIDLVVEIMDDGELDARIVDGKHTPLTKEQEAIAIKCAEESLLDYDADDLLDAALSGLIDTSKKLQEWHEIAKKEQE